MDSVIHVVCSLCVCGVHGDDRSAVKMMRVAKGSGRLINGGSNICVTGNLSKLLDVENIIPIDISVTLEGTSSSLDNRSPSVAYCLSLSPMVLFTTKRAFIVPI
jgi:hypothetical protein